MRGSTKAIVASTLSAALCVACSSAGNDAGAQGEADREQSTASAGAGSGTASDGSTGGGDDGSSGTSESPATEVLPPPESESGLPGLDDETGPLVELPLPDADSAEGGLVAGYPDEALPVAPRSQIAATSVSPADDRLQVALTASTALGSDRLLRFYRLHLAELGFTEKPTPAVGGSSAAGFERGADSVVVTVTPGKSASEYSVYGTLYAGQG